MHHPFPNRFSSPPSSARPGSSPALSRNARRASSRSASSTRKADSSGPGPSSRSSRAPPRAAAALSRRDRAGLRRPHLRPRVRPEPGCRRDRGTGHDPALLAPQRPLRGSTGPRRRDDGASVERDGKPLASYSAAADVLRIPLAPALGAEERTTLVVRWGGAPPRAARSFWTAPSSGPAVSSLAEPFDARTFWPCVDDPADKAVTTVAVTVPEGYVAVSAGLGTSAPAAEAGKVTWTWRLPQPISTYLVSIAVGRFETITAEYLSLDGTRTMPVVGYVVPEHADYNRARVASMVRHLEVLASLFGEYPYLDRSTESSRGASPAGWSTRR